MSQCPSASISGLCSGLSCPRGLGIDTVPLSLNRLVLPPSGGDGAVPGGGCFACCDLTAGTGEGYGQKGPKWECILPQSLCSHCWIGSSLILPRFCWDTGAGRDWLGECSVQPTLQQCQPLGFSFHEYESQKCSLCVTPV